MEKVICRNEPNPAAEKCRASWYPGQKRNKIASKFTDPVMLALLFCAWLPG